MSSNVWIGLGVLALAFSAVAIPYGFHLRSEESKANVAEPYVSVESHGQENGITANSVSIENMTVIRESAFSQQTSEKHVSRELEAFVLADCTFDAVLEIPPDRFEVFRNSVPGNSGTLTVILYIFQKDSPDQPSRIQLTGDWEGTSGMIPRYSEDVVAFAMSDRRFALLHKKPIVEYVSSNMRKIKMGKQYFIRMTGFPGFGVPLIPVQMNIRTHEGVLYSIADFKGPDKGWYTAMFSPQ